MRDKKRKVWSFKHHLHRVGTFLHLRELGFDEGHGEEVRYCLAGRGRLQDHHVCPPEAQPSADGFCQRQEKCKIRGHGERGERGGRGRRGKRLRKRQFCVQRSWQLVSFRIKVNWDCNVYSLIISLSIPFSHHVCFAGIHSEKLQPWSILLFHCTRS